jgi:hypothetical protein
VALAYKLEYSGPVPLEHRGPWNTNWRAGVQVPVEFTGAPGIQLKLDNWGPGIYKCLWKDTRPWNAGWNAGASRMQGAGIYKCPTN